MRTLRTLKPGQKRTKELLALHGASLLCVRYRYDEDTHEHLKTVELVIQGCPREGEAESPGSWQSGGQATVAASRRVAMRIGWQERTCKTTVSNGLASSSFMLFVRQEVQAGNPRQPVVLPDGTNRKKGLRSTFGPTKVLRP